MIQIVQLIWDDWNIEHIARHDVIPQEVEEVCEGDPFWSETYQGRLRLVGNTKAGRTLTIILAPKTNDTYYPVTARSASRQERKRYADIKRSVAA